jgi:hypothetical protein
MSYDPANWYWSGQPTGQSSTIIYSSSSGSVVAANDTAYVAWQAVLSFPHNAPSPWPNDATGEITFAALDAVLERAGLPPTGLAAPTQMSLLTYANAKQWALATGGYTVTVNSAPLIFPTDVVSMGLITGKAARLAQPNPPASFAWQTPTGFVTVAAADFIAVATQIADFVQSTFDALETVEASIVSGTITTTAAIDAAAWPSNVSSTPA